MNIAPPGVVSPAVAAAGASGVGPKKISKDFKPVTPTRANTSPIYGAEIGPINEPKNRFETFQYPPSRRTAWASA